MMFKNANRGTNLVIIKGNGTTCVIMVTKKMGHNTKRLEVLVCYAFQEGITQKIPCF